MNVNLSKAHDIIKEEQRNSDNKAYIFVVLLGGILGYVATMSIPANSIDIAGFSVFIIFLAISIILLLYSLVPKYYVDETKDSIDYDIPLNIYFWKSFVKYNSVDSFTRTYMSVYKEYKLDKYGLDLLEQIYKNAKIMHRKSLLHRISLMFIMFLVYIFVIGIGYIIVPEVPVWIISILVLIGFSGLLISIYHIFMSITKVNGVSENSLVHIIDKKTTMRTDEHRLFAKRIFIYLSNHDFNFISYSDIAKSNDVDYKYKHDTAPSPFRSNISITLGILGTALKSLGLPYIQCLVILNKKKVNGDGYYKYFSRDEDIKTTEKEVITEKEVDLVKQVNWDLWQESVKNNIDKVVVKLKK